MSLAARVLAEAVRGGLVAAPEALVGRAAVTAIGASNLVHRVDLDGRAVAYVKQTGEAAQIDGDDSVARESLVLQLLPLAVAAPQRLGLGARSELWLSPVTGRSIAELSVGGDVAALSEAFAAVGRLLATVHLTPVPSGAPGFRLPWPMLEVLPSHMDSARFHEVPSRVIETARSLSDVVGRARDSWVTAAWTHGDVSAMNVIVGADGTARLIDWEGAGIGDPVWDLAGADLMARLLAPGWSQIALGRLRHAYRLAGGPAREPDLATRCVRTLVAAYQQAAGAFALGAVPDHDGSVSKLLADALRLAGAERNGGHGVSD